MKKVAAVIAFHRFREEELFEPYKVLTKGGVGVDVFSSQAGVATGKVSGSCQVDKTLSELDMSSYDALLLVGGPGGYNYIGDAVLQSIIHGAFDKGKLLAAICMAPQLLAESGLMKGVKSTIFPGDSDVLIKWGAIYTAAPVEVSLPFITADGPLSATLFGQTLLEHLK